MAHASQPPIPSNYVIGEEFEEEDSFFSSVAQCLKQLRGLEFTSEMLVQKCQKYVTDLSERCWLLDIPNNILGMNIQDYLSNKYSHSTRSNPEVDGRIICNVFKVNIHILRKDHEKQLWSNIIMDGSGYRCVNDVDYTATNTIHVINHADLHFRPILKKISKDDSDNPERLANKNEEGTIETYETRKGARGAGGHFYEIKLLMLFYLRLQVCDEFYLAANMANVGAFDDAVFKYRVREKDGSIKTKIVFLQAKHSDNPGVDQITIDGLLSPKGQFSLKKYFDSYQTIKRNFQKATTPLFHGNFKNCTFIIFSNNILALNDTGNEKHISNPSRWIERTGNEIVVGKGGKSQGLNPIADINKDIINKLCCNKLREIAQEIYDYTLGGKKGQCIRVQNMLQPYEIVLANQVFEVKLHPNKSKFRPEFHKSGSLWKEFCQIAGNPENETFQEHLKTVTVNLYKQFGKHEHRLEGVSRNNLIEKLVDIIKLSNSYHIKISDPPTDINKLANNILMGVEGEGSANIVKFRDSENSYDARAFINDFKSKLEQANTVITDFDVMKIRFEIREFPILSLPRPDEGVTEDEVKQFLTKLEFVLEQKNEKDLDEVIKTEIQKTYEVNDYEEKKAILKSVKSKVEEWWKSDNHFLTNQTKFLENAQTSISNFKLNVFESGLKTKIEKTGVQFNEIALDELKNIIHSHKTLNIVTEDGTTLLCVVKSYQTLQREFGKIRYNFMSVDHVLNIQDYVLRVFQSEEVMPYYLVIESNSELLANVQWALQENIRSFYEKLFELTRQSSNKHVILITEKCDKHDLNLHQISLDICFGDLTDQSQLQRLDTEVTIQGMRIKIKELIPWRDLEFRNKISSKLVMSLIDDDDIVISHAPQRLCDSEAAYTKYYEEIHLENFLYMMNDFLENTVIVISRLREKKCDLLIDLLNLSVIKYAMEDHVNKRIDEGTIIIIPDCSLDDALKGFQRICTRKYEKTIYWVEIDSELVRLQQVYYPKFYLKREFRKNVVLKLEILCQENFPDVIVFCAADELKLQGLVNSLESKNIKHFHENTIKNKIIFAKNFHDAKKKYSDLRQNISVHFLKVGCNCNEQLIWEKSQGSIDTIRAFIDIDRCKQERHSEKKISAVKDKVVVIADEPGMGKTTSLTSVSQQMLHENWVIRINFLDCEHAIDTVKKSHLTVDDVYNFVSKVESTGLRNDWAELLMKHKLHLDEQNTRPIMFLFDGFDEISHERRLKLLPFLQFIKYKTAARLWVTTRFHTMDILENGLSVVATEFVELNQKDRLEYLNRFWTIRLRPFLKQDNIKQRTEKYSSCLLSKVSDILGDGLSHSLGVPLQLRLLAEALRQDYVEYMNSCDDHLPNFSHVDVLYVYSHFIREKYEIYIRDKNRLNMNEPLKLPICRSFDKYHEMLAFNLLFPEDKIIIPKSQCTDKDMLKSVGIIQSIGVQGKPHFIHRTFAEYFVAKLLFRHVGKKEINPIKYDRAVKFLIKYIFEESNHVIRNFTNHLSIEPNEDFPIHFAAFRNKLKDVMMGTANSNKCDKFGRTPLHIAAWEGHLNVVKALLDSGCDAIAQDALGKTALHYAVMNRRVTVVKHILNYTTDVHICDNIFAKPLHIDTEVGDSLFRDPELLKSKLIVLTNIQDIEGKAALHYATEIKEWEIAKMLIDHGANVRLLTDETALEILNHISSTRRAKEEYEFGYSGDYILGLLMLKFVFPTDSVTAVIMKYLWAGHMKVFDAVRGYLSDHQISKILERFTETQFKMETIGDEDHLKVSKYLMQERSDQHMANRLAEDATMLGNLVTVNYVLSKGHKNDYISYMKCAIKGHNLNIVKHLEGNFRHDEYGNTALHLAACFGSLQIVKYLGKDKANVKALNKQQMTPLDIAIRFENRIVEPYLRIKSNLHYYKPLVSRNSGNQQSTLIPIQNTNTTEISEDEFEEYFRKFPEGIHRNGATKLHRAAYNGQINQLQPFNVYKNVEIRDNNGYTPLHYAVKNDQIEMVKFLLLCHVKFNPESKEDNTPLDIARGQSVNFMQEIHDIFNIFQNGGSNVESLKSMQLKNNDSFMAAINCKDNYGNALLGYAVSANDIDSVLFILRNGGSFRLGSHWQGSTELFIGTDSYWQGGTEVRHLLTCLHKLSESILQREYMFALKYIECFDKYTGIADVRGRYNANYLHDIGYTNSVNYCLLDYLVKHGANINAVNRDNDSVLSFAINSSNLDMVKYLLYKGVNIKDLTPHDKQRLFDCAKKYDRPDITDLFNKTLLEQTEQAP